uniref:Uncharacterized protein n=1 Tax=Fagus sylvatica TaxID=28930 RepID=A0A2N9E1J2_FAGSY
MRHIVGKLSTSSFQRYKVCANRSSDEGVMAPGSRGVGAVFVHSSDADSGQTGDAIGEPRVPRRSRSHYLSNAPGLADQLVASRKDSAREGGSCAAYFCKVPDSRESELGLVRYGPASRVHRGVFGPFEGSFPIGIPADPDKFLAIREFHVVHGCVLLSNVPGLADQLVASQEDSVRKRGNVGGKSRNFQQNLILPCTEASLGSSDMILRTEAVGMFLMLRVLATTLSFLVRFRPVKYGIEALDILYTLVKGWRTLVGLGTARSNLGQTSVNPSQTWSTLVKLGQTLGNVSRTFFLGVFDAASPRRIRPAWFGLSRFARRHPRKSRGTLIDDQSSPTRPIGKHLSIPTFLFSFERSRNEICDSGPNRSGPPSPRNGDELGTNRPGPPRSRNEICDSGPNRSGPPSPRNGDELGTNRPGPPRSRNEICDSGPNRSGPPSPRNGDELGTNRPSPSRSRNEICDSGPNRSGPPSPRNGDELGTNRPGPSRSRNEICDSGPNRSGPPSPRNGDELGTNRPSPSRSRNEICDSGPNRSGPPSPRNGDELGTNRPSPSRSRNEICDSGPNRSGPPSPRNGDELGTNRPSPSRSRNEICDSGPNRSGPPSPRNGDELGTNRPVHPGLETKFVIRVRIGLVHPALETETNWERIGLVHPGLETKFVIRVRIGLVHPALETETNWERIGLMSDRGSGSGGHRRSDRLAKGKAVAYAPESSPDTDDEYDAMEDVRTRVDASLARDLQAEFDAEATGPASYLVSLLVPAMLLLPHLVVLIPGRRDLDILPMVAFDRVIPVAVEISDTPLLTNLLAHPSSLVRRCQEPPDSAGPSIPYVSVYHPAVWCFIERFFHHTGTFHLSTCEMAVLPVDWSAILGIRFGGRAPPSEPIDGFEAMEILGLADRDAIEGVRRPSVRIRHLLLPRE